MQQVGVAEGHTLGPARGSGGVQHRGDGITATRRDDLRLPRS